MFDVVVEAEEVPLGFYGFFLVYLQKFLYKEQAEPPGSSALSPRMDLPMASKPPKASTLF